MPNGTFGGFVFDPEVFAEFMQRQPTWRNEVLASGIVVEDSTIMDLIGEKGNVATLPFYNPLSIVDYPPLNNDGATDQVPQDITGGKQTCAMINRMQAWTALNFTKELTGADPLGNVAGQVGGYYTQVWEQLLMLMARTVLSVAALSDHTYDISAGDGETVAAENLSASDSLIYAKQKALGDMAFEPGLLVMNSMVYARYQELALVDFDRYVVTNALGKEVRLPSIGGDVVIVRDRDTSFTNFAKTAYRTFVFGPGAFLTAEKKNLIKPYYVDYDAKTKAGTDLLYTKQARVLHPNGISFDTTAMAKDSPTDAELGAPANWSLQYDSKNVRIGQIITNG